MGRVCKLCGERIYFDQRASAKFCSRIHKDTYRLIEGRARRHGLPLEFELVQHLMLGSRDAIVEQAPPLAVGYRCIIHRDPAISQIRLNVASLAFPEMPGNRRLTLDGRYSSLPYFSITPFEYPRLPFSHIYDVVYIGDLGSTLQKVLWLRLPGVKMSYGPDRVRSNPHVLPDLVVK